MISHHRDLTFITAVLTCQQRFIKHQAGRSQTLRVLCREPGNDFGERPVRTKRCGARPCIGFIGMRGEGPKQARTQIVLDGLNLLIVTGAKDHHPLRVETINVLKGADGLNGPR